MIDYTHRELMHSFEDLRVRIMNRGIGPMDEERKEMQEILDGIVGLIGILLYEQLGQARIVEKQEGDNGTG